MNKPTWLETPLERLLGPRTAKKLNTLGLHTAHDLLHHYPRRYLHWNKLTPLNQLHPKEEVTILARVQHQSLHANRNGGVRLNIELTDGYSTITATFFATHPAKLSNHQRLLKPGSQHLFAGTISQYRGQLQLTHPSFEEATTDIEKILNKPIPIYPANSKTPTWISAKAIGILLDQMRTDDLLDPFTPAEKTQHKLLDLKTALEKIHRPETDTDIPPAKRTLKWVEAYELQTAFALSRHQNRQKHAQPIPQTAQQIIPKITQNLPWQLTNGQHQAIQTILNDLNQTTPMLRLLQADVGAGKTIVAAILMATVVNAGHQAALLAPTEVLAEQHAQNLKKILPTPVELLTGSSTTKTRKHITQITQSGQPTILVGTHALLQDTVNFHNLALIVIDEQHRFGVAQREKLRENQNTVPHLLSMTATPIPRTIAMTIFGDLDTTEIRELPKGRIPVKTHTVNEGNHAWMQRLWVRAAEEIHANGRVFVVTPRIADENTDSELASVTKTAQRLRNLPALKNIPIAELHGKLTPAEKTQIINDFNTGKLKLLVTTTVIEVGVDIKDASLMVILDAQQFGLSQLHQLRGRVGRSGQAATCIAVYNPQTNPEAIKRLQTFATTTNGFELAEYDLKLRREGNVLGQNQTGKTTSLKALKVLKDADIITDARKLALTVVAADPELKNRPALAARVGLLNAEAAWMERV